MLKVCFITLSKNVSTNLMFHQRIVPNPLGPLVFILNNITEVENNTKGPTWRLFDMHRFKMLEPFNHGKPRDSL